MAVEGERGPWTLTWMMRQQTQRDSNLLMILNAENVDTADKDPYHVYKIAPVYTICL